MKREELNNTKVWIKNEQELLAVEKKCLALGFKWRTNAKEKITSYQGEYGLYLFNDNEILCSELTNTFKIHPHTEIQAADIIGQPVKPKNQIPLSAHTQSLLNTLDNLV